MLSPWKMAVFVMIAEFETYTSVPRWGGRWPRPPGTARAGVAGARTGGRQSVADVGWCAGQMLMAFASALARGSETATDHGTQLTLTRKGHAHPRALPLSASARQPLTGTTAAISFASSGWSRSGCRTDRTWPEVG